MPASVKSRSRVPAATRRSDTACQSSDTESLPSSNLDFSPREPIFREHDKVRIRGCENTTLEVPRTRVHLTENRFFFLDLRFLLCSNCDASQAFIIWAFRGGITLSHGGLCITIGVSMLVRCPLETGWNP
jgi:hypothetical protein